LRREAVLQIPKEIAQEMIAHALEEDPNECCGLLAAQGGKVVKHYRITNAEKSPYRYRMDPKGLLAATREIEDRQWQLLVIYHSHTHSEAYPSQTDVRMALWRDSQEAIWPDTYYALVSLMDKAQPHIRAFRIQNGGAISEEQLVIA
jgi:proteasome lid subunit RPN8/RPN11